MKILKKSLELVKNGHSREKEIIKELRNIYIGFAIECTIGQDDCLDSLKHSLANNEPLSGKYNIKAAYKNLNIVVEALELLRDGHVRREIASTNRYRLLDAAISLQKKNERSARRNATAATATKCNEPRSR